MAILNGVVRTTNEEAVRLYPRVEHEAISSSARLLRIVEQVEGYSALIDEHADLFAEFFGALLGEGVSFDGPTEKWIVWPEAGPGRDPRETELSARGIRVVTYATHDGSYSVRVGDRGSNGA